MSIHSGTRDGTMLVTGCPPVPKDQRNWHPVVRSKRYKFIDISFVKGGMDGKQRKKLLTLVEVCCVALLAPPIVCLFLVPCSGPCYRRGPRRTPPNEVTDEGSSSSLLSRPSSMMVSDCDVRSLCSDRDAGSDLNDQALRMHNPVPIRSLGLEPRTNCSMVRERHCSSDGR